MLEKVPSIKNWTREKRRSFLLNSNSEKSLVRKGFEMQIDNTYYYIYYVTFSKFILPRTTLVTRIAAQYGIEEEG